MNAVLIIKYAFPDILVCSLSFEHILSLPMKEIFEAFFEYSQILKRFVSAQGSKGTVYVWFYT